MDTSTLFNDKADLYASSRPSYPKELFDLIASLVTSHHSVWDCASGNGQAALGLSKVFDAVEASDISMEQIDNAFAADNVRYSVQSAESTNYADNQFDLVNVAQALHWFDFETYWDEVARVLKPDGAFTAFGYAWPEVDGAVDDVVERRIKTPIAPYWARNNKLAWDGYRDIEFPFTPLPTPSIDLINHWNLERFVNYLHTWSATRRCIDDIGENFFETAKAELLACWGDPTTTKTVRNPLFIVAGSAWS